MTKIRPKPMTQEEFAEIKKRDWQPVKLVFERLPSWMQGIPPEQRAHVYASGSFQGIYNAKYKGESIGGMDIFRDARTHPEKFNWNKDHYVIIIDPNNKDALLMYGPLKDSEHWINEIPDRLKTAEILTHDKKKSGSIS